jgi:uridine kinase
MSWRTSNAPVGRPPALVAVADRIVGLPCDERVVLVAIDGVDGAGKTTFADDLASVLERRGVVVLRVSVDGFHHPRVVRYRRGRHDPDGFFLDSYDHEALTSRLLAPIRSGEGTFVRAIRDVATDEPVAVRAEPVPAAGVLVLDGIFLHRDELVHRWDLSVFLDVPFAVSVGRCARRDGTDPDPDAPSNRRYVEGQRRYLERCRPRQRATLVIDHHDGDTTSTPGDWPAWATAPIQLADPDPAWPRRASVLATDVAERLGSLLDGAVEHVGSTAVPGLVAKPVLDLLAPVRTLDLTPEGVARLAGAGWELVPPELDARPWRRLFVLPDGARRVAHLQLVARDHPRHVAMLRFRDELRRHPDLAAAYARLKTEAVVEHTADREAYTAAKSSFVAAVVAGTTPPDVAPASDHHAGPVDALDADLPG